VVAAGNHGIGCGQFVTKILLATEQIELAHRHRQIVLLLISLEDRLHDRFLIVGVGDAPVGRFERALHLLL
jgi:hypothetical protein